MTNSMPKLGVALVAFTVVLLIAPAANADPLQLITQTGGFQLTQMGNNGNGILPTDTANDSLIGDSLSTTQLLAGNSGTFEAVINPLTFTQGFTGFGSEGVFQFSASQLLTVNGQTQTLNILGSLTIGHFLDSVTILSSDPVVFDFGTFSVTATVLPTSIFPDQNGNFPGLLSAQFTVTPNDPATVPEPASMLLLGAGLAGVAAKVRNRRAKPRSGK